MRKPITDDVKQHILNNYWYEPITGKVYFKLSGKECGHLFTDGYIKTTLFSRHANRFDIYVHYMVFVLQRYNLSKLENEGYIINHKNGIRDDNRWENLEIISKSLNSIFSAKRNNISGYRGVRSLKNNRWEAILILNNVRYHIASSFCKDEVAKLYDDFIFYKIPNIDKRFLNFPDRIPEKVSEDLKNNVGRPIKKLEKPPISELQQFIKSNFIYNSETGDITSLISNKKVGSQEGKKDYFRIRVRFENYSAKIYSHRMAWFLYYNYWLKDNEFIDHINHDKTDNRIVNLRVVSSQENNINKKLPKNNKLGYMGVAVVGKKYRVSFEINKISFTFNRFNTPEQAAEFYDDVKYHFFGDKAHLNFPDRSPQPVALEILEKINRKLNQK